MLLFTNLSLGHGEVGFSLAKNLVNAKHAVTILQDSSADMNAQPFCEYPKVYSIADFCQHFTSKPKTSFASS